MPQTLRYSVETLPAVLPDVSELLVKNWREISAYPDVSLKPDFDRYMKLEQSGKLLISTVRNSDKLVGYCVMILDSHIHYKDMQMATNDVIYLSPEYREGRAGIGLIRYTEDLLKGYLVAWHAKIKHPALGKVLEHLGYTAVETLYTKRLGE